MFSAAASFLHLRATSYSASNADAMDGVCDARGCFVLGMIAMSFAATVKLATATRVRMGGDCGGGGAEAIVIVMQSGMR